MPKVELKVFKAEQGLIEAPDFCPFAKKMQDPNKTVFKVTDLDHVPAPEQHQVVHASICQLCRLCEFQRNDDTLLNENDLRLVGDTLTNDKDLLLSIVNQAKFLRKNDRIPLAILISFETLRNAVYKVYEGSHFDKKLAAFSNSAAPICFIVGIPVYFSTKLTKSPAQVVGEVEWSN